MSSHLLLIPTDLELTLFMKQPGFEASHAHIELCGFGPIVAAARTAALIAKHQPKHVCLVGIAGSLGPNLELGKAYFFERIVCYGIGAGSGKQLQSAGELGWLQWPGPPQISEHLSAVVPPPAHRAAVEPELLTSPTASRDASEAEWKVQKFRHAAAEDMESFAVATACRLAGIPLTVIRGISNAAGNRDHKSWQIEAALCSAAEQYHLFNQTLGQHPPTGTDV